VRRFWALVCMLLILLALPGLGLAVDAPPAPPAKAYLLMDAATGQVLYEHESRAQLPMASTTKIMTAILALERGNLADVVTVGRKPYDTGGTTIYLEMGERQTLQNLLYALLLESANDAAVAIAEHLAGTEEAFAGWMNARAKELGATQTHFVNSHGLHDTDHYTTAYDLARIARYAMRNPKFRELVTTEEMTIPGADKNPPRQLQSHNRLLGYYEGVTGVKNGYTEEADLTNVASAKRGETELIAVVLGAKERLWTSSMALLDFGFSHYRTQVLARKGDLIGPATVAGAVPVAAVASSDLVVTVPLSTTEPERRAAWEPGLKAPMASGVKLGRLEVVVDGTALGSVDLVSAAPVQSLRGAGVEAALGSLRTQASGDQTMWLLLAAGFLGTAALVLGRRKRRPSPFASRRIHGRDRPYQIRNRRRL